MASNLSSIGFDFADASEFQSAMLRLATDAVERLGCSEGDYSIWRSRTGAEIWFHLPSFGTEDDARDIAGLTPFFEGSSEVMLEIAERLKRPDDNAFEGAFRAAVRADDGKLKSLSVVVDAVDFATHAERPLPFRSLARLTVFGQAVSAFADEAAYLSARRREGEPALGAEGFLPVGQFANIEDEAAPLTSDVLFTGRIVENSPLVNEASGKAFHWLVVATQGVHLDVVVDPAAVRGKLLEGGVVEVGGMLFGRLLEG